MRNAIWVMTIRRGFQRRNVAVTRKIVAVLAVSICVGALSPGAYGDEPNAVREAARDAPPIRTSAQPPAKFFTINGVLAKSDRAEGRGKGAIRLASLKSWNTMIDARPPTQVSARGTEPFVLFQFP